MLLCLVYFVWHNVFSDYCVVVYVRIFFHFKLIDTLSHLGYLCHCLYIELILCLIWGTSAIFCTLN